VAKRGEAIPHLHAGHLPTVPAMTRRAGVRCSGTERIAPGGWWGQLGSSLGSSSCRICTVLCL
jgi:hypothetical protein